MTPIYGIVVLAPLRVFSLKSFSAQAFIPGGGVLPGVFGGGVLPASSNPDPISDQKMPFPPPVLRPGLKNPDPFSDLTLNVIKLIGYASVLKKMNE